MIQTCCIVYSAVHRDMVQDFRARIVSRSRVLLEWKPPERPGVTKYKVSALFTNSSTANPSRSTEKTGPKHVGRETAGSENEGPHCIEWKIKGPHQNDDKT